MSRDILKHISSYKHLSNKCFSRPYFLRITIMILSSLCKVIFYSRVTLQLPIACALALTLILHLLIVLLLLEIVVVVVIVIVQLITRVLGRFGKVDGFTACAPAVADDVVRVDFLHVVLIFFFGFSHAGISSALDMC